MFSLKNENREVRFFLARLVPILIKADGSQAKAEARAVAAEIRNINNLTANQVAQNFGGFDVKEIQRYIQATKEAQKIGEIALRANAKLLTESARQTTNSKRSELKTFEQAERHKQRLAEISAIRQVQAVNNAAKAQENAKRREYSEFVRLEREKAKAVTATHRRTTSLGSEMFTTVFGANLSTLAVDKTLSLLTSTVNVIKELSVESIKLGGNFEVTQNAMKVFSGSTARANSELADISETARNTAGLRLIPAEEGMQRLRGLGFEATRAKSLIKELSEEKILSGASNEAFDRVIFNFTQIASGGQKISQEIRELLTAMPSLRRAFLDAFGTLNPQKIQSLLDSNPNEFFDKLIAAMEKTKGVQGGLNDAQDKFFDELIRSGREFSAPFIPQLTRSLRELTKDLENNKETFKSWGQGVGDALTFVSRIGETRLFSLGKLLFDIQNRLNTWVFTGGVSGGMNAGKFGENIRRGTDFLGVTEKGKNYFTGETEIERQTKAILQNAINASEVLGEVEADIANKIFEATLKQERERQKSLASLSSYYSERFNIIENGAKIEEVLINSRQTLTAQDEIKKIRDLSAIKSNSIRQQIAEQTRFYNQQIALSDGSQQEIADLTAKRNNTLRELNFELLSNEIGTQKQIADKERQILEQRRRDLIQFKNLQIQEIRQISDIRKSDAEKLSGIYGEQFNKLIQLTNDAYIEISRLTRESYDLQLTNESLTSEQIVNLNKEKYLELNRLAQENSENIQKIEEERFNHSIQLLKRESEQASKIYQSRQGVFSNLQNSFFQSNLSFGAGIPSLKILDLLGLESGKKVLESVSNVLKGNISLYEAQKSILEKTHLLETTNLRREIALKQDLINLERIRLKGLYESNLVTMQSNRATLINQKDRTDNEDVRNALNSQISKIEADIMQIQKIVEAAKRLEDETDENYFKRLGLIFDVKSNNIQNLTNDIFSANDALKNLGITQAAEVQKLYEDATEGLKQLYREIESGQKDFLIRELEERKLWTAKVQIIANIKALEQGYYKDSELLALQRKERILQAEKEIWEVKQQLSEKGIYSEIEANAKVLQHINQDIKSVTDTVADFKINLYDGFMNALLSPFDALQERLEKLPPFIREISQAFLELARDVIKAFSQKFIMRLLGLDGSGGGINLGSIFSGNAGGGIFNFGNGSNSGSIGGLVNKIFGGGNSSGSAGDITGLPTRLREFNHSGGQSAGNALGGGRFGLSSGLGIAALGAGIAGGLIGGKAGTVLSSAASGLGIGLMIGGPVGAAVGIGVGVLSALFGGLFSNPKRKIDKQENMPQLQKGFADAMKQLRDLAADKRAIYDNPDDVLSKAMELRAAIASGFGINFQSKKYRNIANQQIQSKLAEADALIKSIREMSDDARRAIDIDSRLETSFAGGVFMDRAFMRQLRQFKRRNGILAGSFTGRDSLPSMLAPGEMVLNPYQISAVRRNAGFDAFQGAGIPNYAGGTFVPPSPSVPISANVSAKQPIVIQVYVNNSGMVETDVKQILKDSLGDSDVQVEVIRTYDKGKSRRIK